MTGHSVLVIEASASVSEDELRELKAAGIPVLVVDDLSKVRVMTVGLTPSVALHVLDAVAGAGENEAARRIRSLVASRIVDEARKELRTSLAVPKP